MWTPWVEDELQTVDLKDKRLDTRLGEVLSQLSARPEAGLPQAAGGRTELTALYRLFDNPKASFEAVLAPHVAATRRRVAAEPWVLVPQDTTELDVTRPASAVTGVGPLGGGSRRGLLVHVLHAFTPDGTPLGTLDAQWLAREEPAEDEPRPSKAQKAARRKQTPLEEKESRRWVDAWQVLAKTARETPGTRLVGLADSEGDIYELLDKTLEAPPNLYFLLRAGQDRALKAPADPAAARLRAKVAQAPVRFTATVQVRPRQAKVGCTQHRREQTRLGRPATVEVRAQRMTLRPPHRPDRTLAPVEVNAVWVREAAPPSGEGPVDWLLLTNLPVDGDDGLRTAIDWYGGRWGIEVFFRTLKTGCRVERRRFEHVDRLTACLAVYLTVAWRTLYVCHLGRRCPEVSCEAVFEPAEWQAVYAVVHRAPPPAAAPSLGEMVQLVARLGGYLPRKNSPPGPQTVWQGLQRTYDMALCWQQFGPGAKDV
jgi:hypothetical protein